MPVFLLKKLFSYNFLLPFIKGYRFIFIYHDISDVNNPYYSSHYSTNQAVFIKHLDFIQKNFRLVSLDEITNTMLPGNDNFASIVFDDGFKSIIHTARPILSQRKIPYAVFVNKAAIQNNQLWVSGLISEHNNSFISRLQDQYGFQEDWVNFLKQEKKFNDNIPYFLKNQCDKIELYMNEADIRQLHADGVTIGSHTVNHPVLSLCSKEIQKREIIENKIYLDTLLDQDTHHFAFPFGKKEHFTTDTLNILKLAGHKFFYTSNPVGFKTSDIVNGMKLIPRIGMENNSAKELMFYVNRQFIKSIDI